MLARRCGLGDIIVQFSSVARRETHNSANSHEVTHIYIYTSPLHSTQLYIYEVPYSIIVPSTPCTVYELLLYKMIILYMSIGMSCDIRSTIPNDVSGVTADGPGKSRLHRRTELQKWNTSGTSYVNPQRKARVRAPSPPQSVCPGYQRHLGIYTSRAFDP